MNRKTNRVWKVPTTWSNIKALFETTRYSWNYSIIYKYQNWLKVLCINYHIITITIGAESIVGYNCCRLLLLRQFNEWLKNWCMWIVREYGSQWPRVLKIWCQPFVAIKNTNYCLFDILINQRKPPWACVPSGSTKNLHQFLPPHFS